MEHLVADYFQPYFGVHFFQPTSWLDERLGADTELLGKATSGFLGSRHSFGPDLVSLHCGQELKGFRGLGEGLRKVA